MSEKTKHTPTPFASITMSKNFKGLWFNFRGKTMMTCNILDSEMPAWEEIVRAVNSYESHLALIKELVEALNYCKNDMKLKGLNSATIIRLAEEVFAKASKVLEGK